MMFLKGIEGGGSEVGRRRKISQETRSTIQKAAVSSLDQGSDGEGGEKLLES